MASLQSSGFKHSNKSDLGPSVLFNWFSQKTLHGGGRNHSLRAREDSPEA